MYKITWDKETGGVLLSTKITKETLGYSPRPVFFEELDMLGLDKHGWNYPQCNEPLMWAINKQYYYKGKFCFEAKGANIYDVATVVFHSDVKRLVLEPIDVKKMLERNADPIFLLESEAIEFIRDVFVAYSGVNKAYDNIKANQIDFEAIVKRTAKVAKRDLAVVKEDCDSFDIVPLDIANAKGKRILYSTRIDRFIASFSGGKDSQVVLDLCTRAIPPTDFEVIYSDTGYELPPSLVLYEEVQKYYHERFPNLKFSTARNHESVLNYWDKIGTPSDTHRWCCSVMKTAPLYRLLKTEDNKQARVLTFDGVRAEESVRRNNYNRIGKGVKHSTVVNASPILHWNTVEIFLYLFKNKLHINPAYRNGMTRVGCLICPFSSEWNDMIASRSFKKELAPFLSRIESRVKESGVSDFDVYIKRGNWKRRAGGRDMKTCSSITILKTKPHLVAIIKNAQKDIFTWLTAVGEYAGTNRRGELYYKGEVYSYMIKQISIDEYQIAFFDTEKVPLLQGMIKRALFKTSFCINCEACEVECPTGALSVCPEVKIDKKKCVHCHKCLSFHEMGCIVANSLKITQQKDNKMKLVGYNNFGLNGEWLDYFFKNSDTYFDNSNHGLNIAEQLPNFVKWLVHAEILSDTKNKQLTSLGKLLQTLYNDQPTIVWEIIWINLTYNSAIAKWYAETISANQCFSEAEMRELVKNDYPDNSDTSIKNIVYALFRTFKESPIGEDLGLLVKCEKLNYSRVANSDLSREAVAYSIYKYADERNIRNIRVSDFYSPNATEGVYLQFGIPQTQFTKELRSLSTDSNRVLIAELNMGLDHITLRDDLTAFSVLENLIRF